MRSASDSRRRSPGFTPLLPHRQVTTVAAVWADDEVGPDRVAACHAGLVEGPDGEIGQVVPELLWQPALDQIEDEHVETAYGLEVSSGLPVDSTFALAHYQRRLALSKVEREFVHFVGVGCWYAEDELPSLGVFCGAQDEKGLRAVAVTDVAAVGARKYPHGTGVRRALDIETGV